MTREEQLDWLCRLRSEIYVYMPKEWLIPMNNALDMVIKELEQESKTEKVIKMRDATLEERESISKYIKSISRPTGIDFWNLEQEPRWIPVSEKLPKETGWYYVTFEAYGGERVACELSYRKPENYWTDKNISRKVLDNNEVIAWMPLPKPYETESEVYL